MEFFEIKLYTLTKKYSLTLYIKTRKMVNMEGDQRVAVERKTKKTKLNKNKGHSQLEPLGDTVTS